MFSEVSYFFLFLVALVFTGLSGLYVCKGAYLERFIFGDKWVSRDTNPFRFKVSVTVFGVISALSIFVAFAKYWTTS